MTPPMLVHASPACAGFPLTESRAGPAGNPVGVMQYDPAAE